VFNAPFSPPFPKVLCFSPVMSGDTSDTAVEVTFLSCVFKDRELERWVCVRGIFNFLIATAGGD